MTLIVFACVGTLSIFFAQENAGRYQEPDYGQALLIAAAIAVFFGLCGMAMGSGYDRSAKLALTVGLGVNELAASHPMTQRVHALAAKLNLPPPSVALMHQANAYAIGSSPEDAAVVLGVPLVKHLTADELDAVIGHELGHIVSGDMRRMQFAEGYQQMFVSMFVIFVNALVQAIAKTRSGAKLGYTLGDLGRVTLFAVSELAVKRTSRSREYVADAIGAVLTSPEAMQGALNKIHNLPSGRHDVVRRYQSLMFCGLGGGASVFGTHPTLNQRIAALDKGRHIEAIFRQASGAPARPEPEPEPSQSWRAPPPPRPDWTRQPDVSIASPRAPLQASSSFGAGGFEADPELEPRSVIDVLYERLFLVSCASFITGVLGGLVIF